MPNPDAVERIAAGLATLVHPGDADTPPFPLQLPEFQTAALPEAMREEMAEDMGMPSPDIAKHFTEALLHLAEKKGYELVDGNELRDLRAAAAANEGKRNAIKQCRTVCGQPAYRIMFRDFDTDEPVVPCAAAPGHECKAAR